MTSVATKMSNMHMEVRVMKFLISNLRSNLTCIRLFIIGLLLLPAGLYDHCPLVLPKADSVDPQGVVQTSISDL